MSFSSLVEQAAKKYQLIYWVGIELGEGDTEDDASGVGFMKKVAQRVQKETAHYPGVRMRGRPQFDGMSYTNIRGHKSDVAEWEVTLQGPKEDLGKFREQRRKTLRQGEGRFDYYLIDPTSGRE